MQARKAIRLGIHRREAIAALRQMVRTPDSTLHGKAFDKANETLLKHQQAGKPRSMLLPASWRGLIGGLPKNHKFMPDNDWSKLSQKEHFPEYVESQED